MRQAARSSRWLATGLTVSSCSRAVPPRRGPPDPPPAGAIRPPRAPRSRSLRRRSRRRPRRPHPWDRHAGGRVSRPETATRRAAPDAAPAAVRRWGHRELRLQPAGHVLSRGRLQPGAERRLDRPERVLQPVEADVRHRARAGHSVHIKTSRAAALTAAVAGAPVVRAGSGWDVSEKVADCVSWVLYPAETAASGITYWDCPDPWRSQVRGACSERLLLLPISITSCRSEEIFFFFLGFSSFCFDGAARSSLTRSSTQRFSRSMSLSRSPRSARPLDRSGSSRSRSPGGRRSRAWCRPRDTSSSLLGSGRKQPTRT